MFALLAFASAFMPVALRPAVSTTTSVPRLESDPDDDGDGIPDDVETGATIQGANAFFFTEKVPIDMIVLGGGSNGELRRRLAEGDGSNGSDKI